VELIAGVDEAGRGPLAGPVVAAAVIFNDSLPPIPFKDSKLLTQRQRERLYDWLMKSGAAVGIGVVRQDEIDRINILQASLLAMKKAVLRLDRTPEKLLIDGQFITDLPLRQEAVVKGDRKIAVISAASVIAKVTRDKIMRGFHRKYPQYGFDRHKGYPTRAHKEAILKHGVSPIHRFNPSINIQGCKAAVTDSFDRISAKLKALTFGRNSEKRAASFLEKNGYTIIDKNYRCRQGEIDLIANDGDTLVFCEVKARSNKAFGTPLEGVTRAKVEKIRKTAEHYMHKKGITNVDCRFDVVAIDESGKKTSIELIRNAF